MSDQIRWNIGNLTDLIHLERGTEPGRSTYCNEPEGIRFIRVGDISGKGEEVINTRSENIVTCKKEDILMSFDGTPGIVAKGFEGAISSGIRIVRPKDNTLDQSYLYHYLKTERVQKVIKKYTANQNIAHSSKAIPHIQIIFPSAYTTQEKNGSILDLVEKMKIDRLRSLRLAGTWIQSLLNERFGDPIANPNNLPIARIQDIATGEKYSFKSGPFGSHLLQHELKKEGIRVLYPEDISNGKISDKNSKFITNEKYKQLEVYTVKPGDIVISLMGTLGRVAVVPVTVPKSIISKHLLKISLDRNKYEPEFLRYLLYHPMMLKQISLLSVGQTQKGLNTNIIKKIRVILPKLTDQIEFVRSAKEIESYLELIKISYFKYEQLYQALINELILVPILKTVPVPLKRNEGSSNTINR